MIRSGGKGGRTPFSCFGDVALVICFSLVPILVQAQGTGRIFRVGFLAFGPPPPQAESPTFPLSSFREELRGLGYVEGQNLILETRWAGGKREKLSELAADLVRLNVDIMVASGASAVRAAKNATKTIPIVMAGAPDPVAFELVSSLAKPGGNVTGLSDSVGREVEGKRLELLKETVPKIARVAVVLDSASRMDITPAQEAARALGLSLLISPETATPTEFISSIDLLVRREPKLFTRRKPRSTFVTEA